MLIIVFHTLSRDGKVQRKTKREKWFLKILNWIGFIHMHFFADFAHWLCYTHSLMLTYSSAPRCPNSLARISCWGIADKGTLTFDSHHRFQFLLDCDDSPWFLPSYCSGHVKFCGAFAASVLLPSMCCGLDAVSALPDTCLILASLVFFGFTAALCIKTCSTHTIFKASSVVSSGAFICSCCHLHSVRNTLALPLLCPMLCPE